MTPELKQLLAKHRTMHRAGSIRRWWVLGLLALALPLAALACADGVLVLDKGWRWLGFAAFLAAALWMLLGMKRARQTPGERDVASVLDAHSSLAKGHAVSTSAQLDAPRTTLAEEGALLARLHAEAGKLAASATVRHPGPRPWQVAGALCGVLLLGAVMGLHGLRPVMRMLLPWSDLPYTTITLAGPAEAPLKQEAFTVSGTVKGRIPKSLVLQAADGPAITVPVAADGSYRHTFENGVPAPVVLTARGAADGVSPAVRIDLGNIPQATEYAHRITPPPYTRQPERIETQASFTVLRATKIAYVAIFDRAPTAVRMVFDNDLDPLDLQADPHRPLAWGVELPLLERTCGYHLEVAEQDGVFRMMGEPQQIVVFPDKPPVVDVASHNGEKLKTRKDSFTMNFDASDDIGLADVRVLYRRVGDKDQTEIAIPLREPLVRKQGGTWQLPLAEIKAEPHDMVAIVVQARDGNTLDGPGIGNSDPIIIEIPEDTDSQDQQAGGGGGGGGQGEQINPLEIQQQLYRETLRLSLGRKAPPKDEIQQRQQANVNNLAEMAADPQQAALGEEYLALLETARKSAAQAASYLRMNYSYPGNDPLDRALTAEASAVDALLKAARIAQANQGEPPPGGEGQGQGGKQFSLTKSGSPKSQPQSEEQQREQIEQALADIEQALKEQEEINQQIGENSPGENPQQGQPQAGQQQEGQPGESQASQGSAALAQRQGQARDTSDQIRSQMEGLGKSENGADPALAAEQLRQASEFQAQAAQAIAKNAGNAEAQGKSSADALRKAQELTRSLLGESAGDTAEPRAQALEYQHLIQEYTRRLSYDD